MKYLGSKRSLVKHILPLMLESADKKGLTTWIEPFVGGANMIEAVPTSFRRIGYDANPHTIAALVGIRDRVGLLPDVVSEELYNSVKGSAPNPVTSWIRFECSFASKFEGGYARNSKGDNYARWGKNHALKQSPLLQGVELECRDYRTITDVRNSVIYCDPPYFGTTGYKTGSFDHKEFWDWVRERSKYNIVFVSEYTAPDDMTEVWSKPRNSNIAPNTHEMIKSIEKLFTYNG